MNLRKKTYHIIPPDYRKKIPYLFIIIIIGMIFEVFGIGVLLPILTSILNPDLLMNNERIKLFFETLGISDSNKITEISLLLLFIIYFFKAMFLLWSNSFQNKLTAGLTASLSNQLYEKLVKKNYLFHALRNSSETIKLFQIEVNYFNTFFLSTIYLITETSIVFAILLTLIFIEPTGTISIISIFLIFGSIFYVIGKKLSSRWGSIRESNDNNLSKLLIETFGGIKELIISNSFEFFINKNSRYNKIKATISSKNTTLNQVPRYYLELVTVGSFIAFIFLFLSSGKPVDSLVVLMGVFIASTLRILPSINRILGSLQQIKYYQSSIDVIYNHFIDNPETGQEILNYEKSKISFKSNFSVEKLNFFYNQKNNLVLKDVSFKVNKGSIIGIIGSTGSGKSTLVNIISGLIYPLKGNLMVDGRILNQSDLFSWRNSIGYVSQNTFLSDSTILENIAFGIDKKFISDERVQNAIQGAQIKEFIKRLPKGLNTIVGERGVQFSGGEQQRIGIARALYRDPEILILDEATSALDTLTEEKVMKSVYDLRLKKTIIIVTHRLSTLKNCEMIYHIKNGILNEENLKTVSYDR